MRSMKRLIGKKRKLGSRGLLAAALALAALGLAAAPASAATVVVNTTTDQALGSCSGSCSLRDAVATANPGDTVQIPAGTYVLTLGHVDITQDLTLVGAGARTTVIDGNASSRIFLVSGIIEVVISDLSLINGMNTGIGTSGGGGGAILATGPSTTTPVTFTLRRCTVANNQATEAQGGGLFMRNAVINLAENTIINNTTAFSGGGLSLLSVTGSIVNNTFSGNSAFLGGGLGFSSSTISMINNTITVNQSSFVALGGGGIFGNIATATLSGNILSGNLVEGQPADCNLLNGTYITDHNLQSDNSCSFTGPGDQTGVNPLLGPLTDNGGPTDTYALLAGSPALDAGNNSTCPAADQRGVTRPQGPFCDMGAFEVSVPPTPQDQIETLIDEINDLVAQGALAPNKANPLITKLEGVSAKLDGGQVGAACNQFGAFINQVNAYIGNGTLSAPQGQALIDAANDIKANIGCP